MTQKKVLFVCLGNICRSPLAEAIFIHKVTLAKQNHLYIADSCGTAAYHINRLPDPRTLDVAQKNGIPIQHRGRQLTHSDLINFDLILPMDKKNKADIMKLSGSRDHIHKIQLLRSFDPNASDHNIPDPYYGDEKDFQKTFERLDHAVNKLLDHLKNIETK